ncbi:hypothetical protein BT63DRAFT_426966 [Microthyrium microscopicum]|uniref:RING-type E3 ubiquitin transferase n=1 Tax=Microthyrium microscopicum TaxID=703497 RepID=A0A6A6U4Z1_9PEZI|nr:hypothetical protein BT63DRAFT_426966 [Microthyrium microscopicum]
MRRRTSYALGSTALAAVVTAYAFFERPNFYSAAVYLSQSSACLIILCNLAFVYFIGITYALQRLLFGPLRPIEIEQLYERGWIAATEWLFALSVFRVDFGVAYMATFVLLFASKVWGWMVHGRLDILEQQPPANARKFHARLVTATTINLLLPLWMANYCFDEAVYGQKAGIMTMFTFEFGILVIGAISTTLKYGFWYYEHRVTQQQKKEHFDRLRSEAEAAGDPPPSEEDVDVHDLDLPGWENKSSFQFTLDITTDFLKLVAYITFFTVLTYLYGLPIYIVRDLYMTTRSFFTRVNDYRQYRNATRNMNAQYPDATAENLEPENTCIVCRDDMKPWIGTLPQEEQEAQRNSGNYSTTERNRPKRLPCGHTLHFSCLRNWLERQQSCPTCRRSVLRPATVPNTNNEPPAANGAARAPDVPGQAPQAFPRGPQAFPQGPLFPPAARPRPQPRAPRRVGWTFRLGPLRLFMGRLANDPRPDNAQPGDGHHHDHHAEQGQPDHNHNQDMQALGPQQLFIHGNEQPRPAGQDNNQPPGLSVLASQLQTSSLQTHLSVIEQTIQRQIQQMQLSQQRVQVINWLLAESNRLHQEAHALDRTPLPFATIQPTQMIPSSSAGPSTGEPVVDNIGHEIFTLPDGWSVVPLHMPSANNNEPAQAGPSSEPGAPSGEASSSSAPNADSSNRQVPPIAGPSTQSAPLAVQVNVDFINGGPLADILRQHAAQINPTPTPTTTNPTVPNQTPGQQSSQPAPLANGSAPVSTPTTNSATPSAPEPPSSALPVQPQATDPVQVAGADMIANIERATGGTVVNLGGDSAWSFGDAVPATPQQPQTQQSQVGETSGSHTETSETAEGGEGERRSRQPTVEDVPPSEEVD